MGVIFGIAGRTTTQIAWGLVSKFVVGSNCNPIVAIRSTVVFSLWGILWMLKASKLSIKSHILWWYDLMQTCLALEIPQTWCTNSSESPKTFNYLIPIHSTKLRPWISPSYSASLFEQENYEHKDLRTCSPEGDVRQIPALEPTLHLAPSKCKVQSAEDSSSLVSGSLVNFGIIRSSSKIK